MCTQQRREGRRETSETEDGTVTWFAVKWSCMGKKHTDAKGDNVGLNCLSFTRPGEGDYTRKCNTSTVRVGRVEREREREREAWVGTTKVLSHYYGTQRHVAPTLVRHCDRSRWASLFPAAEVYTLSWASSASITRLMLQLSRCATFLAYNTDLPLPVTRENIFPLHFASKLQLRASRSHSCRTGDTPTHRRSPRERHAHSNKGSHDTIPVSWRANVALARNSRLCNDGPRAMGVES